MTTYLLVLVLLGHIENTTKSPMEYKFTDAWSSASKQFDYFSNPENEYINGEVIKIDQCDSNVVKSAVSNNDIQVGALLYFVNSKTNEVMHSSMISDVDNGMICYAAHSDSHGRKSVTKATKFESGEQYLYVVRIKDDAK